MPKASEISPKIFMPMLIVGALNALGFFGVAIPEDFSKPETIAGITSLLTAVLGWLVKDPARG